MVQQHKAAHISEKLLLHGGGLINATKMSLLSELALFA